MTDANNGGVKAGFWRILKSRIVKDIGFQWNPTDIPTNSNGFHRIPTDPNGFHRKKYEKIGKCWKKSEIYDPTFYDPTLAFSDQSSRALEGFLSCKCGKALKLVEVR